MGIFVADLQSFHNIDEGTCEFVELKSIIFLASSFL